MQKTQDNKIEITTEVIETVDLIQLDTEIAHLQDIIHQTQIALDDKQKLRDSITQTFPEIEIAVYQNQKIEPVETLENVNI